MICGRSTHVNIRRLLVVRDVPYRKYVLRHTDKIAVHWSLHVDVFNHLARSNVAMDVPVTPMAIAKVSDRLCEATKLANEDKSQIIFFSSNLKNDGLDFSRTSL